MNESACRQSSCGRFEELKTPSPDEGTNAVIRKDRRLAKFIGVDDRGILLDVDDPVSHRTLK